MISINLYQPIKLDLTLEFPTTWNELYPAEVLFISKTLLEQNEVNAAHTRPKLLKHFIEFRAGLIKEKLPKDWITLLDHEQAVIDGYPMLDFIFNENDLTRLPEPILFHGILSFGEKYYPQPFDRITCGEFEDADIKAREFMIEPSAELLAGLAAILFRPLKNTIAIPSVTHREKQGELIPYMKYNFQTDTYFHYKPELKENKFRSLLPEKLYAIYIWYAGCRSQLPLLFPSVFDGEAGQSDILAFTNCIHSGAGPKNGTREQIRVMKLYEFMYDMEQEAIKAIDIKEEYERNRNKQRV